MKRWIPILILLLPALLAGQTGSEDVVLKAMKDEIERARTLAIASLDDPYYIEYTIEDVRSFSTSAALGSVLATNESRMRVPRVKVRVGDYKFDNTNFLYSDFSSGARYDPEQFPLDNDYGALRRCLWLATDRAFKGAVEAITRKRAALKNVTQNETLPDFWPAKPAQKIQPIEMVNVATEKWTDRVRTLSSIFLGYPEVLSSNVTFSTNSSTYYFVTSEGTVLRRPDPLVHFSAQAQAQAADGTTVRDSLTLPRNREADIPSEADLKKLLTAMGNNVRALVKAPAGESYAGPVLFEGIAGPQLIAELLAPNLVLGRRPVGDPSRPIPFLPSELEGRIGSRVLPEFLDVVDDPTQTNWNGTDLLGTYAVDEEGVVPEPVKVIEKGQLKSFLLTRQPVKGFEGSNGRARMPGGFGARGASVSNLFVQASKTVRPEELRRSLIEMVKARSKPYGILVKRMDFPSTAPAEEVRKLMMAAGQSGTVRAVSAPLLVYRLYPDGREELIRGVRFRNLSVRSLREITAVSDETLALHYLNNGAPMALLGAGSYVAPVSVIGPSLLFDELEVERPQEDTPKLPLVAAPELTAHTGK